MASKIYVGRGTEKVPFLENTTDIMIDTGIDYTINTNFELDFEYVSGTTKSSWHHILNAGGTGTSTVLALSASGTSTKSLQLEAVISGTSKSVVGFYTIAKNKRYLAKYRIADNKGTYSITDHNTGEVLYSATKNLSTSTIQSLGKVCIYNQQNWDGATASSSTTGTRGAYIKIYSLKIYDGDDLVMDLIPDPEGEEGTSARFYDLVSEEYVSYKYSGSAIYKEEYDFPAVEAKKIYVGVNGEARKVKKAYVGVNDEATLFYTAS